MMGGKKTYGVATLIRRLRGRWIQSALGDWNTPGWRLRTLRESLADIDYVRDQVVAKIKELEETVERE